jgi:hypothetical protein
VPPSDQHLHDLLRRGRHRHRHAQVASELDAEVEVLAQEDGGERRREIRLHIGRRLVAGEQRAHDAAVDELEQGGARDAGLLGENGDLRQRLRDHPQQQVVADLREPGLLVVADVGRALPEEIQVWLNLAVGVLGA